MMENFKKKKYKCRSVTEVEAKSLTGRAKKCRSLADYVSVS